MWPCSKTGRTIPNQNCIKEEIKIVCTMGKASYNLLQYFLYYSLLSNATEITITGPTNLFGYETLSLTMKKQHRLIVRHENAESNI